MKIAIDGLSYFLNKADAGEYTRSLVNDIVPLENDIIYLIKDKEIVNKNIKNNKLKVSNLYINRINSDYTVINDFIKNTNTEIYHCTNNGFSLEKGYKYNCKVITTINNFIPNSYEGYYNPLYIQKYFNALQIWDSNSHGIICPSYQTKDALNKHLGIDKMKIFVVYPKIKPLFSKTNNYLSSVYIKSKFNFNGEYILFSGDLHKRKRLETFIEIFYKISEALPNLFFVICTEIDEKNYPYYKELKEIIEELSLSNKVIFITDKSSTDRLHLYNNSKLVIDFSYYDDLNISLMEAMATGANIICSDIPLNREILRDYPLYLNIDLPFIEDILVDYLSENYIPSVIEKDNKKQFTLYDVYKKILS